jgi:hypothetical protein
MDILHRRIDHLQKEVDAFQKGIADANRRLKKIEQHEAAAGATAGALVGGGLLWWGAKILSPLCGPAVVVCAVAL